jgi:sterol desaturase/sphingolipid hydroxylase (fatty acid hydroxylase superfamily)
METVVPVLAGLALGLLTWPLIEYGVHGVLGHRHRTFVTPLHAVHHREPRAVFTSPAAWIPVTLVIGALATWLLGAFSGGAFSLGALTGFLRYEYIHWRIHFRLPRNAAEKRRRDHHLAHHYVDARNYHGVTTRFWDRVLGTLPERWERDYDRATHHPPLQGKSNLGQVRPTRV